MSIDVQIRDGGKTQRVASVLGSDGNNALFVQPSFAPPPVNAQPMIIFRQYFTDDGLSTGSNDMRVDGSSTNQSFYIPASSKSDRYITQISFEIADASQTLNEFGNLGAALTNGCQLTYDREGFDTIEIHDALKTNWDFVRLCQGNPAFGTTTNAFLASNVIGASEAYIPVLDFTKIMPPFGVKIAAGTTQRLSIIIRDNTTGVDSFNAIAYGFDRIL